MKRCPHVTEAGGSTEQAQKEFLKDCSYLLLYPQKRLSPPARPITEWILRNRLEVGLVSSKPVGTPSDFYEPPFSPLAFSIHGARDSLVVWRL